jgi:hypothetical protein
MTPPADFIECANCDRWFTGSSLDEVFYHATCACRRELTASPEAATAASTVAVH